MRVLAFCLALGACSHGLEGARVRCPDSGWASPSPDLARGAGARAYSGMICTSRYLSMRDGVKIAIDLYLPEGLRPGERIPALIRQTCYGRSYELQPMAALFWGSRPYAPKLIRKVPEFFVSHGYAWVEVDVRGSGASFGYRPYPFTSDEIRDGAEIVDWIVRQAWSNGKVGAIGASYGGVAADMILVNGHPAVKAVAPLFCAFDLFADQAYPGGVHLVWFTDTWGRLSDALDRNAPEAFFGWEVRLYVKGTRPVDEDKDRSMLAHAVLDHARNVDIRLHAGRVTFRDERIPDHPDKDMDVFSPHTHVDEMRRSGAAVYSYSGWFDGACVHSAIKRYLTVINPGSRLTLGPWSHGGYRNLSPCGNGVKSCFDEYGELLRFFDRHLKGRDSGIAQELPVHYYTMGEERWKASPTWPPPGGEELCYFLAGGRRLIPEQPEEAGGFDTYRVDLTAGTGPWSRWRILMGASRYVLYPKRAEQDRKLLCYTSRPLDRDLEVTGHPLVTLFVSSSACDGNLFVYLEDVDEAGKVRYVTEGELRALHRKVRDEDESSPHRTPVPYHTFRREDAAPLVPGGVAELTIDLQPTSYRFKQGHAIRLALAGADKDFFAPLSGEPPDLTFHRGTPYPSRIALPVMPSSQSPE